MDVEITARKAEREGGKFEISHFQLWTVIP